MSHEQIESRLRTYYRDAADSGMAAVEPAHVAPTQAHRSPVLLRLAITASIVVLVGVAFAVLRPHGVSQRAAAPATVDITWGEFPRLVPSGLPDDLVLVERSDVFVPEPPARRTTVFSNVAGDRRMMVTIDPQAEASGWTGADADVVGGATSVDLGSFTGLVANLANGETIEVWGTGLTVEELRLVTTQALLTNPDSASFVGGTNLLAAPSDVLVASDAGYPSVRTATVLRYASTDETKDLVLRVESVPFSGSFEWIAATEWQEIGRAVSVGATRATVLSEGDGRTHLLWVDPTGSLVSLSAYGISESMLIEVANNLNVSAVEWSSLVIGRAAD